ncbi:MAG: hypothetical protein AB1458_03720 [Bacteroidota bacterium]
MKKAALIAFVTGTVIISACSTNHRKCDAYNTGGKQSIKVVKK